MGSNLLVRKHEGFFRLSSHGGDDVEQLFQPTFLQHLGVVFNGIICPHGMVFLSRRVVLQMDNWDVLRSFLLLIFIQEINQELEGFNPNMSLASGIVVLMDLPCFGWGMLGMDHPKMPMEQGQSLW